MISTPSERAHDPVLPPEGSGHRPPQERYQAKLFPGSSHTWACARLGRTSPSSRVLDIGPGSGVMGRALRDQGSAHLCAVEIDPEARRFVAPLYDRVAASLDELDGETYDTVLLLDVLEHMATPESFLSSLKPYLRPGATVLVSVPNIAHWSVRIPLVFGHFAYTERGILDRTHLQFFTRGRVRALAEALPGLRLIEEGQSIVPLELIVPEFVSSSVPFEIFRRTRRFAAGLLPGLCAYQLLARFSWEGA